MNQDNMAKLMETSVMAVGYLVAKHGPENEMVIMLAKALKECGCESSYITEIASKK